MLIATPNVKIVTSLPLIIWVMVLWSGMGQNSWHIWDIFLVSVVLVTNMSSWVWVIICILVGGVGCHIILTKSDRTIIYEPDESSYKPTPIPLTSAVQVDFRAMKAEQFLTEHILRNRQHFQQPQLLKIWLWQLSHHKTISKFLFFLDSWRGSSPSPASLSPFSFQGMLSMDFIQYPKCQMWIDTMTSVPERM